MKQSSIRATASIAVLTAIGALGPTTVLGQAPWPELDRTSTLGIEISHPFIEDYGSDDPDPFGSVWLSGRYVFRPALAMAVELPISLGIAPNKEERNVKLGNPYVGLEVGRYRSGAEVQYLTEIGLNLPLVQDPDDIDGLIYTHGLRSFGALWPDLVPVTVAQNVGIPVTRAILLHLRLGPSVWLPTEGGDPEFFAVWGMRLGITSGDLSMAFGMEGWSVLSDFWFARDDVSFDDRTVQQFVFEAGYDAGRLHPYAQARVPFGGRDEWGPDSNWILTIGSRLPFR